MYMGTNLIESVVFIGIYKRWQTPPSISTHFFFLKSNRASSIKAKIFFTKIELSCSTPIFFLFLHLRRLNLIIFFKDNRVEPAHRMIFTAKYVRVRLIKVTCFFVTYVTQNGISTAFSESHPLPPSHMKPRNVPYASRATSYPRQQHYTFAFLPPFSISSRR